MARGKRDPDIEQCWSCKHWNADISKEGHNLYEESECKRHAPMASSPQLVDLPLRGEDRDQPAWWSTTIGENWCSEYLADVDVIWRVAQKRALQEGSSE